MKKILVLTLSLIMVLSLCACGTASTGDNNTQADSSTNDSAEDTNTDTDTDTNTNTDSSSDKTEETGYVGTWVYEIQRPKGTIEYKLVINEDGTATETMGSQVTNLIWYEDDDTDAIEGAIEISREDNVGFGEDAYITEDGKLYKEVNIKFSDADYDHFILERQ